MATSANLPKIGVVFAGCHTRIPLLRKLPFPVVGVIGALLCVNVVTWAAVGIVLVWLG